MSKLSPEPVSRHSSKTFYVPKDLSTANYVFLRRGPAKKSLESPYTGPYKVLQSGDKTFKIEVQGKETTVTIDRLKPAYLAHEDGKIGSSTEGYHNPAVSTPTPNNASPSEKKTRSGRTVRFPDYFRP